MNDKFTVIDLLKVLDDEVDFTIVATDTNTPVASDTEISRDTIPLLGKFVQKISWDFGNDQLWIEV